MPPHARAIAMLALAAIVLPAALRAQAWPAPGSLLALVAETRAARLAGDHRRWHEAGERVLALAPDHPDLLLSASRANAALGRRAPALAQLGEAIRRGAGTDPARFAEYAALLSDSAFQALAAHGRANLAPVARARTFATLPAMAEGIAFDPTANRLFVGAGEANILQIDADGRVSPFVSGQGLRQVLGLKVDPERRLLWAVSGRFPNLVPGPDPQPADVGTSGIYAFRLGTGARVAAHELDERPVLHGFNDMAIARDGTVYVTDSAASAIYVLDRGAGALRLLMRDPTMSFPNGIVLSPDERWLYVAHVEGLSRIDPRTGARTRLRQPADAAVNSIDGLAWHRGDLLGVQPSPYLHRVVRVRLTPDGEAIAGVTADNARTPAEYNATTAAVGGDSLFVVGGNPTPDVHGGAAPGDPRPQVWRVPLETGQPS